MCLCLSGTCSSRTCCRYDGTSGGHKFHPDRVRGAEAAQRTFAGLPVRVAGGDRAEAVEHADRPTHSGTGMHHRPNQRP